MTLIFPPLAKPGMGGPDGHPTDQKVWASRGYVSFKSLTFRPSFVWKWTKSFQLQGALTPNQGLCPWTPLRALPPDLRYGVALRARC